MQDLLVVLVILIHELAHRRMITGDASRTDIEAFENGRISRHNQTYRRGGKLFVQTDQADVFGERSQRLAWVLRNVRILLKDIDDVFAEFLDGTEEIRNGMHMLRLRASPIGSSGEDDTCDPLISAPCSGSCPVLSSS